MNNLYFLLNFFFNFSIYFSIFFISHSALCQEVANKKLSSVELQWEEYPSATKYEMQVFNSKDKLLKTFYSKTSLIKFNSTSGKVKIRGRYVNGYGKISPWSRLIEVSVPPEPVKFDLASNGLTKPIFSQASNKSLKGTVEISWPTAAQAKKYKLKIYDTDKKVAQELMTSNHHAKIDLETGSYQFSITSIGNDDVQGKEVFSNQNISIGSAQLPDVIFKVENVDLVKNLGNNNDFTHKSFIIKMPLVKNIQISGTLEFSYHLSEDWKVVKKLSNIVTPTWNPEENLEPGKYRVSFWTSKKGWIDSSKFTYEFVIKPNLELY